MHQLSLKTNFNKKLSCLSFVHISTAPPDLVPECKLGQIYQVITEDASHEAIKAQLLYFIRFNLGSAADVVTLPSHGLDAADFIQEFLKENPSANYGTELAAYYYKKSN